MAKTKDRSVQIISGFRGQSSGTTPDSVEADLAERIKNMVPIRRGLTKVNGRSVYGTLAGNGNITMLEYYSSPVSNWIAQQGTDLLKEATQGSGTFASFHTLDDDATLRATRWKDAIYFANGTDLVFFNGNLGASGKTKRLGMYPPLGTVQASDSSVVNGGSLTDASVYRWTITYYDPDTDTESPAVNSRPAANGLFVQDPYDDSVWAPEYWEETTATPNLTGRIAFSALNAIFSATGDKARDARQTHFKLYRTTAGGTIFRQVGDIRNIASFIAAAVDLDDGTADSTLGVVLQTADASPPPRLDRTRAAFDDEGLSFVDSTFRTYVQMREFKDSLFGFGAYGPGVQSTSDEANSFSPYKSILYIHDAFIPDYVFTTRDVADGDGQLPTGLAVLKDNTLLLFKESSTYYLSGTNVRNYEVRPLDTRRGAVATGSIQETPYGVLCLDRSGVILFDGLGVGKEVSDSYVEDEIRNINFSAINTTYSFYDRDESIYYLSIPVDGSTKPNRTLIYNVKDGAWTFSEGLEGYSAGIGIVDSEKKILIGDSVNTDKILDWSSETNVLDVAKSIESEYLSSILYMGDASVKKKAKFLWITAESNTEWTVDIGILPDFGQGNGEFTLENINSASSYAVYAASLLDDGVNVGVFDTSIWSGAKVRKILKIPVSSMGYGFQIRIKNRDTDPDNYGFRILSLKLEAVELGK
jgi:hypothetical protein